MDTHSVAVIPIVIPIDEPGTLFPLLSLPLFVVRHRLRGVCHSVEREREGEKRRRIGGGRRRQREREQPLPFNTRRICRKAFRGSKNYIQQLEHQKLNFNRQCQPLICHLSVHCRSPDLPVRVKHTTH